MNPRPQTPSQTRTPTLGSGHAIDVTATLGGITTLAGAITGLVGPAPVGAALCIAGVSAGVISVLIAAGEARKLRSLRRPVTDSHRPR